MHPAEKERIREHPETYVYKGDARYWYNLAQELGERARRAEERLYRAEQLLKRFVEVTATSRLVVTRETQDFLTVRTKSGKVLTDEDFEALADEAERGYIIPDDEGDH